MENDILMNVSLKSFSLLNCCYTIKLIVSMCNVYIFKSQDIYYYPFEFGTITLTHLVLVFHFFCQYLCTNSKSYNFEKDDEYL